MAILNTCNYNRVVLVHALESYWHRFRAANDEEDQNRLANDTKCMNFMEIFGNKKSNGEQKFSRMIWMMHNGIRVMYHTRGFT